MAGFFSTIMRKDQLQDGTRRAVMETVVNAREGVEQARNRLDSVIAELMQENDRVTQRQSKNVQKPRI